MRYSSSILRMRLHAGISSIAACGLLFPAPAPGAPATVAERLAPSPITTVTSEELARLPAGQRLENLIRTCPAQTIPTIARQPDALIDGKPAIGLNCNRPGDIEMIDVFKGHNAVRSLYGAAPLAWDPLLERSAADYATTLARTGQLVHASREGRGTVRENISQGLPGWDSNKLFGSWLDERPYFTPGIFPNISTTGDWYKVGHISQVLWPTTTAFGCARTVGGGSSWLVCRYNPGGNKDGKHVGFPLQIAQGGPPVININNPVQQAPPPAQPPTCSVADPDALVNLLRQAAAQSGFAPGSTGPRDATTERQWQLALDREQAVQDRMMRELSTLQGDVAKNINAYLAASATWQERYAYISSTTTGLQGLLTDWLEAREIYEKADFAFALANLGVGGAKLGFKGFKWMMARRAAGTAREGATALAEGATVIERAPGSALANSRADTVIDGARVARDTERMGAGASEAATVTGNLAQGAKTGASVAEMDQNLVRIARAEGVNVEAVAGAAYDARAAESALMHAIATARGWHDIPKWAGNPLTNLLIQARKVLGGVDGARISPQDLEILKSLKTYVESKGINFAEYLRTAAGAETSATFTNAAKPTAVELLDALETDAIVRYFDNADIDLLLKLLDTGGDAAALRNAVSPVTQASLNGLARAEAAAAVGEQAGKPGVAQQAANAVFEGACHADTVATGGRVLGGRPDTSAPIVRPTDAQLANVLGGTGELGRVGLGNVVDQFGITNKFTDGMSLPRVMLSEFWEMFTSPSKTAASFYYTNEAQKEYLDLLQTQQKPLIELGTKLDDASRALRDLQQTLQRAGVDRPGNYLSDRGPADLRKALDDLQTAYDSGSDEWKRQHKGQMDGRRAHINQKLADLQETMADLAALASRMQLLRNWLDSLRLTPDGKLRGPIEVFNPLTFVRLGSIGLYLRGMAADNFGLTTDVPFRVSLPQPQPPANSPLPEDWDSMIDRLKTQSATFDAAPEVAVDADLDAWLSGLDGGK